jgi:hypothetical protein
MYRLLRIYCCLLPAVFVALAQNSIQSQEAQLANVRPSFEQNVGQADRAARFLSRSAHGAIFIAPERAVLALLGTDEGGSAEIRSVSMGLRGASAKAPVAGESPLSTRSNYFIGSDSAKWQKDVPHFGKVRVKDAWPGIDTLYYVTEDRHYEFDFVVTPNADPEVVELEFEGAEQVGIDAQGDLSIQLGDRILQWKKPVAYQTIAGKRVDVAANYFRPVGTERRVKFSLGQFDRTRELVIDPVIVYSTFLGGNSTDSAYGVAVNSAGEAFVTGRTFSIDFPVLNPIPGGNIYRNSEDVFVTKLNAAGTAALYSTYVGGFSGEYANDIAIDGSGNAYVVGRTTSRDFPATPGAKQTLYAESGDGFAFKLGPAGNAIVYSTYIGGQNNDEAYAVAVDATGHAYVVGRADNAVGLITVPGGFQFQAGGGTDGFVVKLHPTSGATVYESFWGTDNFDYIRDVAVTPGNEAVLAGYTCSGSTRAPLSTNGTPTVFRPAKGDSCEIVITKAAADGASRIWATYFGGNGGNTEPRGIGLDSAGNVYFTGTTLSSSLPTTPGAPQPLKQPGTSDGFVAKLNSTGTALIYSTYLGGDSYDEPRRLVVQNDRATVAGYTQSANFPRVGSLSGRYYGAPSNLAYSTTGGASWQHPSSITGTIVNPNQVRAVAVDPTNPNTLYAGNNCCHILKSTDGGATWSSLSTPGGTFNVNAFSVSPTNPSIVYAATSAGVLKSTDSGMTWAFFNTGLPSTNMNAIAVSLTDPNLVVVGSATFVQSPVFLTTNGGTSWTNFSHGMLGGDVRKLLANPEDGLIAFFAATSTGVYMGSPSLGSWLRTTVTTGGVDDIAVDATGSTIYAASGTTIWRSTDILNWTTSTIHGIKSPIRGIAVDRLSGNTLYANAFGRGMFKSTDGAISFFPSGLEYSTISSRAIAVGSDNRVHVGFDNQADVFVTQINETGTAFVFSSLLGGPDSDTAWGVDADPAGNVYVAGEVNSRTFPTTAGAFRRSGPLTDGFVTKIGTASPPCSLAAISDITTFGGGGGTASIQVNAPPGCEWTATTAADWILLHRLTGNSSGSEGFYATVRDNFTGATRTGSINLSGPAGSAGVTITQVEGAACPYFQTLNGSTLPGSAQSYTFEVITLPGCPWSLAEMPNWITASPTSGAGSGTINIGVPANPNPASRSFGLNFGAFTHTVTQATGCAYAMSPTTFNALPAGGDAVFNVYAPAGCPWAVSSLPTWAVPKTAISGSGNGAFTLTLLPNHGGFRSGTASINVRSATINQSASTCTYSLSATSATNRPREGGPLTVDIITSPGCGWNARANGPWIRIPGAQAYTGLVGTGPATLNMFVLGNPERAARGASVTIAGINFSVTQLTGSPVLASTAFVQNLYWDLLGRAPETGGLGYWVNQLETGASTRSQVAGAYFNAPEFADSAQFAINLYLGILGRDPDFDGYLYWLGQVRSGATRLAMVTTLAAAPEVAAIYDPLTLPQFVDKIYMNLLGRGAAPAEIDFWVASGQTRQQIMLQFLESAEFRDRFRRRALANACYLGFLRRSGEPGGLDFWTGFQLTGTVADMVKGFIESDEYLARSFGAR